MSTASRSLRSHRHDSFSDSRSNPRNSTESGISASSRTTAPTSVSGSPRPSLKDTVQPSERRSPTTTYPKAHRPVIIRQSEAPEFNEVYYTREPSRKTPAHSILRSSEDAYVSKTHDLYDEPEDYDDDQDFLFELPEDLEQYRTHSSDAEIECRATTPHDFADYFPSQRRLVIRHDESAHDGNMNLKVDTEEIEGDRKTMVQLFHLRMQNLDTREFSLRRYCRESGREVCHSHRKYQPPASERPGIQRSVSNALANLRPDFKRLQSKDSTASAPVRADSGYASDEDEGYFGQSNEVNDFMSQDKASHGPQEVPTRSIKLEFSNYAQVDVKRAGAKKSKHYDFEYWGHAYSWKRMVDKTDGAKTIKFHLVRQGSNKAIAHIIPVFQTPSQVRAEHAKGGWVPPCSLWISDPTVLTAYTDVADIKRHFNPKPKKQGLATSQMQLQVPLTPLKMEVDFAGPKAIVNHMFRRRSSGSSAKSETTEHDHMYGPTRQSPLRISSHA